MGLNKPEQDLKRDLQGVASDLKCSAVVVASRLAAESSRRRDGMFREPVIERSSANVEIGIFREEAIHRAKACWCTV